MARVVLGGRELVVADSEVREYLKAGYSLIDDKGNAIQRGRARTYEEAMAENSRLRQQLSATQAALSAANEVNETLKIRISSLLAELDALRSADKAQEDDKTVKAADSSTEKKKASETAKNAKSESGK